LNYLGADINYGGWVTDDKDKRLISSILWTYINPDVVTTPNYKFSKSGIYFSPPSGDAEDYMEFIKNLPLNPDPEVFGLHGNAQITTA